MNKMASDFLITKDNVSDKNKESDDLQSIHIYRGRFLHWMSIIEKIMKEYCQIQSKMMYGQLKYKFICKLKEDFRVDEEFDKFAKALIKINSERNIWAHGIVFYEERKENGFANNSILLNDKTTPLKKYFDEINSYFSMIISWLEKNNLWKIKDYNPLDKFQKNP